MNAAGGGDDDDDGVDCIGKYFAMLEAKMAISRLVMLYDFECLRPLGTPNEEEFQQQVTGIPKYGCEVKLSHRKF